MSCEVTHKGKDTTEMDGQHQDPSSEPMRNTFVLSHSAFLEAMQQGTKLFQQNHGQDTFLKDLALLEFYQGYLTPFEFDPLGNAGALLGWTRTFLASKLLLEHSARNANFLVGYNSGTMDWCCTKNDDWKTDVGFAKLLARMVAPGKLAKMLMEKPWYTEAHLIGYAFGLTHALLSSSKIQLVEHPNF
jgi:hypothetical protein